MKNILTLALFFAAALTVNTASAQEQTTNKKQDTARVSTKTPSDKPKEQTQQDTKSKTDKKDQKSSKGTDNGNSNGTRMAISEQGIAVDKKDKKKPSAKTNTTGKNNTTNTNTTSPKN